MSRSHRPAIASAQVCASNRSTGAGSVRLVGGVWKRTRLPVANRPGLRPTPDRVRETLFNWLGQDLHGWRVLDAFAGTGALGLEAASRGARQVLLLEQDSMLAAALLQTKQRLGASQVEVLRKDALAWMQDAATTARAFDLILLDPPFAQDLFTSALTAAVPLLADGGFIYVEADRPLEATQLVPLGLEIHRQGRAGVVHFHCLRSISA